MYQRGVLHVAQEIRCDKRRISGGKSSCQPACRVPDRIIQPFWNRQPVILVDRVRHGGIGEGYHITDTVHVTFHIALSFVRMSQVSFVLETTARFGFADNVEPFGLLDTVIQVVGQFIIVCLKCRVHLLFQPGDLLTCRLR